MDVKLGQLGSWLAMRDFTPGGIMGAVQRGEEAAGKARRVRVPGSVLLTEAGRAAHKNPRLPQWMLPGGGGVWQRRGCSMASFAFSEQFLL